MIMTIDDDYDDELNDGARGHRANAFVRLHAGSGRCNY